MRSRSLPFWISAFLHIAAISVTALLFVKPPEFAMDPGHNSVEVNLVAAAPDPIPLPPAPEPVAPEEPQPPKPDDLTVPVTPPVQPTPTPQPEQPPVEKPVPPAPTPPKPHHTTTPAPPKPGPDDVTASSDKGAIMDVKPDYLSNPAPLYPESARREKQEGVVVLEVVISEEGRPDTISVQTSSGFTALDQSAVTAVRKWRFRPASLGSIKVKSRVVIPVRFRLDN